jgi:hypothetical protein
MTSDVEHAYANARLIAAAPELLKAAQDTLRHVVALVAAGSTPEPQMIEHCHKALYAAIAKATGSST